VDREQIEWVRDRVCLETFGVRDMVRILCKALLTDPEEINNTQATQKADDCAYCEKSGTAHKLSLCHQHNYVLERAIGQEQGWNAARQICKECKRALRNMCTNLNGHCSLYGHHIEAENCREL